MSMSRATKSRAFAGLIAAAVGSLVLAGAASAQAEVTEREAAQTLREAERAFDGTRAQVADPTVALRDLALAAPALQGAKARRARSILARPPGGNDPYGGGWPGGADEEYFLGSDFIIHYATGLSCDHTDENCDEIDESDDDGPEPGDPTDQSLAGNDVPDYVENTAYAYERSNEVENLNLDWPLPKGDGSRGEPTGSSETDRLDIYISDLCNESTRQCVFGYANPEQDSCNSQGECGAYLVLDNDYKEFGESGGLLGLRVTTAHEYNHILQFRINSNLDSWMFESSAVWSEEKVFPDDDDWVRSYIDAWVAGTTRPMTKFGFLSYGWGVWNHWLENGGLNGSGYGADVVLDAWETSQETSPRSYAVGAYDTVIKDQGGIGFEDEFVKFAASTIEWRAGDGNFPDGAELDPVLKSGTVTLGKKAVKKTLDNTSFVAMNVNPKSAEEIKLKVSSDGKTRWGLALIGRDGTPTAGTVTKNVLYRQVEDNGKVALGDVSQFDALTAVIVNADGRINGGSNGSFSYKRDNRVFKVKLEAQ